MKSISELLREEMQLSADFSRDNFGMIVGDGFRELVLELSKDNSVVAQLIMYFMMTYIGGEELAKTSKESLKSGAKLVELIGSQIPRHIETFRGPLEMLYWGIHIGRKLEQDEAKMMKDFEKK